MEMVLGIIILLLAERSAARLAHQSGGLGVPSSNLGAPTSYMLEANIYRKVLHSLDI
jgi:hypothetical protein